MSESPLLYEWLASAGLAKYYTEFLQKGVTAESLPRLTMQDYGHVGVEAMSDRKRLFQLIQILKSDPSLMNAAAAERSNASVPIPTGVPIQSPPTKPAAQAAPVTHSPAPAPQMNPPAQLPPSGANRRGSANPASNPPQSQNAQVGQYAAANPRKVSSSSPQLANPTLPPPSLSNRAATPDEQVAPIPRRKYSESAGTDNIALPQIKAYSGREASQPSNYNSRSAPVPESSQVMNDVDFSQKIRVCVRKRPMNKKELGRAEKDVLGVEYPNTVVVFEPKVKVDLTKYVDQHQFIFDMAFDENCSTAEVYEKTAKPLVSHIFNKGKATCFAYGQTGSGKTFTMMGNNDGIYILAAKDIFQMIQSKYKGQLTMWVSFFEIYGGKLFDLLHDRRRLFAREDAKQQICITGLQEIQVDNIERFLQLMDYGTKVRSTGSTAANADSSRSHAILQVVLKDRNRRLHGKFSFIDLAGSERGADHLENNDRQTRMECAEINKSLLALKECIRALDQESKHTPFRGSKLTQVLKDSFIGNSKTVMIAAVAPSASACENTLNTLRYAYRVKELGSSGTPSGSAAAQGVAPSAYPHNVPGAVAVKLKNPEYEEDDFEENEEEEEEEEEADYANETFEEIPEAEEIVETHNELLATIGEEEEDLLVAHREQIDQIMEIIKAELTVLNKSEQPGYTINSYVDELDELLLQKLEIIGGLRDRIKTLRSHWRQEERLTQSFKGK